MKGYMKKVGKTLLMGLIILVVAGIIYLVVPKYQIQSVRVDDDYVVVTRINNITGEVSYEYEKYSPSGTVHKIRFIPKFDK